MLKFEAYQLPIIIEDDAIFSIISFEKPIKSCAYLWMMKYLALFRLKKQLYLSKDL